MEREKMCLPLYHFFRISLVAILVGMTSNDSLMELFSFKQREQYMWFMYK
jgi:hypothetical protein